MLAIFSRPQCVKFDDVSAYVITVEINSFIYDKNTTKLPLLMYCLIDWLLEDTTVM